MADLFCDTCGRALYWSKMAAAYICPGCRNAEEICDCDPEGDRG